MKLTCHCGKEYNARPADIARGWAKSCSKSCAAKVRNESHRRAWVMRDAMCVVNPFETDDEYEMSVADDWSENG